MASKIEKLLEPLLTEMEASIEALRGADLSALEREFVDRSEAAIKEYRASKCEGCDGSGIRLASALDPPPEAIAPPPHFVIVKACDQCDRYGNDLDAARAYGTSAHWQAFWPPFCNNRSSVQAICIPKEPA